MKKYIALFLAGLLLSGILGAEPKKWTIKGFLYPNNKINVDVEKDNYAGTKKRFDITDRYEVDGGFGLGVEYSIFNNNSRTEVLAGASWSKRSLARIEGETHFAGWLPGDTMVDNSETLGGNNGIQITSFYIQPRFLTGQPADNPLALYAGLSLSYNLVSLSGDAAKKYKLSDTLGWGLSFGSIISDTIDIALNLNPVNSSAALKSDKTVKGYYNLYDFNIAVGYRL
ncbi:MAG: hypothetical protein LBD99_01440 [Candidatus Margulisbacteria bacterium]|nr:hypothetical protein [Candidatus Margulisiibacteriota bacterium]